VEVFAADAIMFYYGETSNSLQKIMQATK